MRSATAPWPSPTTPSPGSAPRPSCLQNCSPRAAEIVDARGQAGACRAWSTRTTTSTRRSTRVIPAAQDAVLFDWLKTLYPIWAELTPDDVFVSTQLALTELLLSGCTTSSDHHYLWPNGCRLDDQFAAADDDRRALPRRPRQHEPGREPGRPAAGPRHRGRGEHPARLPPRRRDLPRRRPLRHAPRRDRPVQPLQRHARSHARKRRARPQLRPAGQRPSAHAPGRDPGRRGTSAWHASATAPANMPSRWTGRATTSGTRTASI